VIDDLRRYNEYIALKDVGFKFVRIVSSEEARIKRLIERDGSCDTSLMYNESENGVAAIDMVEVDNNGEIDELHNKLDALMKEWGYEKI
jgi:dephospho-CoA kinase